MNQIPQRTHAVVGTAWFRRLQPIPAGGSAPTRAAWARRVSGAEVMQRTVPDCRWCGSRTTLNDPTESPHVECLRLDAIEDGLPEDIRATV